MSSQISSRGEICTLCKKGLDLSAEERWISCNSCDQKLHFRHLLIIQADSSCSLCKNPESLLVFDWLTKQTASIVETVKIVDLDTIDSIVELEGHDRPIPKPDNHLSTFLTQYVVVPLLIIYLFALIIDFV